MTEEIKFEDIRWEGKWCNSHLVDLEQGYWMAGRGDLEGLLAWHADYVHISSETISRAYGKCFDAGDTARAQKLFVAGCNSYSPAGEVAHKAFVWTVLALRIAKPVWFGWVTYVLWGLK